MKFATINAIFLSLVLLAPAYAIELIGPEEPISIGEIVDFAVGGMTDADLENSDVTHYPREKVRCKPYLTWGKKPMIEFSARRTGKYLLKVSVVRDGKIETDERIIVVGGEDDEPDPFPEPEPEPNPEDMAIVIVSESADRSPTEAILHQQIRNYLKGKSIAWKIADPNTLNQDDEIPEWFKNINQKIVTSTLPVIVKAGIKDGGYSVIAVEPLTTFDAATQFIGGAK